MHIRRFDTGLRVTSSLAYLSSLMWRPDWSAVCCIQPLPASVLPWLCRTSRGGSQEKHIQGLGKSVACMNGSEVCWLETDAPFHEVENGWCSSCDMLNIWARHFGSLQSLNLRYLVACTVTWLAFLGGVGSLFQFDRFPAETKCPTFCGIELHVPWTKT